LNLMIKQWRLGRALWGASLALACWAGSMGAIAHAEEGGFLDPEQAFRLSARPLDAQRIELHFEIAPGYYLYRDKISASALPAGVALGELQMPPGEVKYDENFQKEVALFRRAVDIVVAVPQAATGPSTFKLVVGNQGCADQGLCYPPMQRTLQVQAGAAGLTAVAPDEAAPPTPGTATGGLLSRLTGGAPAAVTPAPALPEARPDSPAADGAYARALQSRGLLGVAGIFLLAGLLLSLTPCVLPMLPILSAIVVGQSAPVSKARGFTLALAYALGMAIVYTAFGIAAALVGGGLGGALQNPWVLGAFALVLVALSLSMFDVYELRLPAALQHRLSAWSGGLRGGRHLGVFAMGGASALVVSPCIAAPLAGALLYISQTRDVLLGGTALFSLAVGMSVPLLLLGLSAGALLPRSGGWMNQVKHFFGLMLLAVALWTVAPVLPSWVVMLLAALLLMSCAVYLGAFEPLHVKAHLPRSATKGLGLLLAVMAVTELAGAASGGGSLLQPLAHWGTGGGAVADVRSAAPVFKRVASVEALEAELRGATRPVMLDWSADWCVACKEFEALTLSQPAVRDRLAGYTLLRVDVTDNSAQDQALLRKYRLFGPPALLFFAPGGAEIDGSRVIGFLDAPKFLAHLARLQAPPPGP